MSDDAPITPRVAQPEDTSVREPWERQRGEGETEWAAFKAYRDQMPPRALCRSNFINSMRIPPADQSRWFREWKWDSRSEAFDVLTDRIIQNQRKKRLEESIDDITADQLHALAKLRRINELSLGHWLEAAEGASGPGLIKFSDLKGSMEAEIKLTRLVKGETTEKVDTSTGEYGKMSEAKLLRLRAIALEPEEEVEDAEPAAEKKRFRAPM